MMTHSNKNNQHKMAFIIWLAIFPLITLTFYLFGDLLLLLPLVLRTFILTIIIVPTVFYIIVPLYTRLLSGWFK
ncbi:hypothetical protein [Chitinophaga sp. RAB17]|uniref:hypothetical protein n=1 Tax=Chitinophaga sp. RAB17 TaxID=3233049 RepID=UPI003F91F861